MDYAVKEMKRFDPESYRMEKKSWLWEILPGIIFCPHFVGISFIRYVKIEYYLINWLSFVTTLGFQDEKKVRATTKNAD